jgi:tRNA-binding protein
MNTISFSDFEKVELRIGTIIEVRDFPEARKPAYQITVDFGPDIGVKRSSAQVTDNYTRDSLIGTQILGVVNIPPRQVGPFVSEFLITGFEKTDGTITLARSEEKVPNGSKLV